MIELGEVVIESPFPLSRPAARALAAGLPAALARLDVAPGPPQRVARLVVRLDRPPTPRSVVAALEHALREVER